MQMQPTTGGFFIFLYFKQVWDGDSKKHVLDTQSGLQKNCQPLPESFEISAERYMFFPIFFLKKKKVSEQ